MTMSKEVQEFLAKGGQITVCPPGWAWGVAPSRRPELTLVRQLVKRGRR
jgi:hypothetical protein